jgi:hypothetical protein
MEQHTLGQADASTYFDAIQQLRLPYIPRITFLQQILQSHGMHAAVRFPITPKYLAIARNFM